MQTLLNASGAKSCNNVRTGGLLDVRLGSGDLGDGDAVRGTGHVVHTQAVEEGDGVRIVGVIPADAHLYV